MAPVREPNKLSVSLSYSWVELVETTFTVGEPFGLLLVLFLRCITTVHISTTPYCTVSSPTNYCQTIDELRHISCMAPVM